MCHNIPFPLSNRAFSVLVVRALDSKTSFVVAQLPVALSPLAQALYVNGRHKSVGDTAQKKAGVTLGQYVSVERVKRFEKDGKKQAEMLMATSSDAGGNLPMAVQKMGVSGCNVWLEFVLTTSSSYPEQSSKM